ncbi:MAG TPA: hypothetical protein VFG68_02450 [Fimbriiglobus sp.]|nr:hypothetical protein [Fimbriiglobus sp.]
MRKFVLAGVALFFTVGLVLAVETVTFIKYDKDKKELTVKSKDDKETTYKVTDKTTFLVGEKDLDHEKGVRRLEKMEEGGKSKGKTKFTIETDSSAKKELKEIKFRAGKKKKN